MEEVSIGGPVDPYYDQLSESEEEEPHRKRKSDVKRRPNGRSFFDPEDQTSHERADEAPEYNPAQHHRHAARELLHQVFGDDAPGDEGQANEQPLAQHEPESEPEGEPEPDSGAEDQPQFSPICSSSDEYEHASHSESEAASRDRFTHRHSDRSSQQSSSRPSDRDPPPKAPSASQGSTHGRNLSEGYEQQAPRGRRARSDSRDRHDRRRDSRERHDRRNRSRSRERPQHRHNPTPTRGRARSPDPGFFYRQWLSDHLHDDPYHPPTWLTVADGDRSFARLLAEIRMLKYGVPVERFRRHLRCINYTMDAAIEEFTEEDWDHMLRVVEASIDFPGSPTRSAPAQPSNPQPPTRSSSRCT